MDRPDRHPVERRVDDVAPDTRGRSAGLSARSQKIARRPAGAVALAGRDAVAAQRPEQALPRASAPREGTGQGRRSDSSDPDAVAAQKEGIRAAVHLGDCGTSAGRRSASRERCDGTLAQADRAVPSIERARRRDRRRGVELRIRCRAPRGK